MHFEYRELQPDQLRLLRPVIVDNSPLVFEMTHHLRGNPPPYTAISYTWGRDPPTERILINHESFWVRRNLYDCLQVLGQRAMAGSETWTHIWVDAICIDQDNDVERSQQVRLMNQVYSHADTVSVWLGYPKSVVTSEEYDLLSSFRNLPDSAQDGLAISIKSLIQELGSHPYWERCWVIQEVLLGKKLDVCFGLHRIEPSILYELADRLNRAHQMVCSPLLILAVNNDSRGSLEYKEMSLEELLFFYSDSKCEDPRDRVFALLGLVASEERELLERFLPDYTMTSDDVIVTAFALTKTTDRHYRSIREGINRREILVGFGLHEEERRRQVLERAEHYDYLGDVPSNLCPWWLEEQKKASEGLEILKEEACARRAS